MNVKYEKGYIQEKPRIPAELHNHQDIHCFHVDWWMICTVLTIERFTDTKAHLIGWN